METNQNLSVAKNESRMLITSEQVEFSSKVNIILSEVASISEDMNPFERMIMQANAIEMLSSMLTKEVMKPIMSLQGTGLGFRTDRDKEAVKGYSEDVVKACFIEATINGFSMAGNQINILAGKPYPTKEGFLAKLKDKYGVVPLFTHQLPVTKDGQTSITTQCKWTYNGKPDSQILTNPVKKNDGMTADGLIGKAERKCAKWIHNKITGLNIADGDVNDFTPHEEVKVEIVDNKDQSANQTVSPEQQIEFNDFISNRSKYSDAEGLKNRANIWCEESGFKATQLDLSVYNTIKAELS